jgi:hypothetical protein
MAKCHLQAGTRLTDGDGASRLRLSKLKNPHRERRFLTAILMRVELHNRRRET